jgi:amidohydrolase
MKELAEFLPELIKLRKELHQHPEISGKEFKTSRLLLRYCERFKPDQVIEKIGRTGLALIYEGSHPGKTVLFRAEMDAVPIEEDIEVSYSSDKKSVSHKCGHDGHMAILVGLAYCLHKIPVPKGRVVLLFQPAEETGKGALAVLQDPKFRKILPDYVFALHNIPGYSRDSILVREGPFAMASEGISVRMKGHAAHAAYPEQGISPLPAILEILESLPKLNRLKENTLEKHYISVTHCNIGRFGYGSVPGTAQLNLSVRASGSVELQMLHKKIVKLIQKIALKYYVEEKIQRWEPFDATVNDHRAVEIIRKVAGRKSYPIITLREPLRWSEDFGQFTTNYPGALFGLGAGENHSDLHTWYYDFPDEIIQTGISMFRGIIQEVMHD